MLSSYPFIDASTEGYEGDDETIYGEEEEHFAHCTNQGKLIPMQALLVQDSKDTPAIYFYLGNFTNPKFLSCKLLFIQVFL